MIWDRKILFYPPLISGSDKKEQSGIKIAPYLDEGGNLPL
jgi:hypothetical protein